MKDRFETWQYIKAFLFVAIIIFLVVYILTGCMAAKINDAQPAVLINSERVKHSTNYIICIQAKDGSRYSGYYNSHCYNCEANIPTQWNVVKMKDGRVFFQPTQ